MGKPLYRYNPQTFRYDPIHPSGKRILKYIVIYVMLGLCGSVPATYWYISKFSSLEEQHLIAVNRHLGERWQTLTKELDLAYHQLDSLARKDDSYYRVLLDLPPLDPEMRQAGSGGREGRLDGLHPYTVIRSNYERLEKLKKQIDVARQSFNQLDEVSQAKTTMIASRPAIQPINKKELTMLHLTFGMRMHPIFKVVMDHKGLDFTAPFGTPVYATADGRVSMAYFSESYGNVVFVDHGFRYETRYAHLERFNVQPGKYVKRGDLIGFVGNTGISAAPHLHYEVFYNGSPVNPIHFFQRDLAQHEYQKIIRPVVPAEQ